MLISKKFSGNEGHLWAEDRIKLGRDKLLRLKSIQTKNYQYSEPADTRQEFTRV